VFKKRENGSEFVIMHAHTHLLLLNINTELIITTDISSYAVAIFFTASNYVHLVNFQILNDM